MSKVKPIVLTWSGQARCSNNGGIPAEKKNFIMKNRFFLSKQFFYRTFAGQLLRNARRTKCGRQKEDGCK